MRKNIILKIRPGEFYSWTLNPDFWQQNFRTDTYKRCQLFMDRWDERLTKLAPEEEGIFYTLYPDISQPMQQVGVTAKHLGGRMHFHGILWFRDWHAVRTYFMRLMPKLVYTLIGTTMHSMSIDLDSISDISVWHAYYSKSKKTMWPTDDSLTNMSDALYEAALDYTSPQQLNVIRQKASLTKGNRKGKREKGNWKLYKSPH